MFNFEGFYLDENIEMKDGTLNFISKDNEDNFIEVVNVDNYYVIMLYKSCERVATKVVKYDDCITEIVEIEVKDMVSKYLTN